MRKIFTAISLCILFSFPVQASEAVYKNIPNAKKVGEGRLTFLLFDIYDSTLYAPDGKFNEDGLHALSLRYLRNLDGQAIAERSVEEIRNLGFNDDKILENWFAQMQGIFPDVKNGTELTAIFGKDGATHFYENGKSIGSITDPDFSKYFSGIWLSEKTSEPELRKKLLGLGRMDI